MEDCNRLDLYVLMILEVKDLQYVYENYIEIREDYYRNKDGGGN